MRRTKRLLNRRQGRTPGQNRLLKESLREFLGTGLLDSRNMEPASLFFLRDALNSRLLNPRTQKN